jgi:integral membrane protein (TIGR01906 family)
MRTLNPALVNGLRILIIALIPIVLVLTNVRLLLTPWFPRIEYAMPGFPPDPYGFTRQERLHWANVALDYLLNDEGIEFLARLRFPPGETAPVESCQYYLDGDCNRLYNDRELRHMEDVKMVTQWALRVWAMVGIAALVAAGLLAYAGERAALRSALLVGAGLTLGIAIAIVLYILVNFNTFFTQFHMVFFEGDTWIFLWSDTLIRLFPLRFWQDAFIFIGTATTMQAVLLGLYAKYRLT